MSEDNKNTRESSNQTSVFHYHTKEKTRHTDKTLQLFIDNDHCTNDKTITNTGNNIIIEQTTWQEHVNKFRKVAPRSSQMYTVE